MPAFVRRILDEGAGFIKDASGVIAIEAAKDPFLVPDISKEKTLFVFSDYSRISGRYSTYTFLVIGRSSADYFNGGRKALRALRGLGSRRISFKGLGDRVKAASLPDFLSLALAMDGILVTFAVDARIGEMFASTFLEAWPELAKVKRSVLERLLRIVHFGALTIVPVFSSGQNIVWFTDNDEVVSNTFHEGVFGQIAQGLLRHSMPEELLGQIVFGTTRVDDGSLEIEDFAAIPDLVAGATCEVMDKLSVAGLRVTSRVALGRPRVSAKTDIIYAWLAARRHPLRAFGVVFDKRGPSKEDFVPTFFSMRATSQPTGGAFRARRSTIMDPIRFDVPDLSF